MSKTLEDLKNSLRVSRRMPSLNVLRVASAVIAGQTLTFGTLVAECTIGTTVTTPGNLAVDVSGKASLIAASGTLTSDTTNVTDNDTVTLGSTVYRFKDTLAQAYDVKIGADAATTLANLKKAINATGTAGVEYYTGTLIHPTISAGALDATTLVVTAKTKGTGGNSLASTEASTHLAFGAATLANGADTSASDFTTALEAAVNAGAAQLAVATRISANEVLFQDVTRTGHVSKTCSETLAGANNGWNANATYGGRGEPDSFPNSAILSRVPVAQEVTLGNLHVLLDFTPAFVIVQIRRAGVQVAWDGVPTISGRRVTLDNAGSTDWAAGDVVTVFASE